MNGDAGQVIQAQARYLAEFYSRFEHRFWKPKMVNRNYLILW
jgi:hypothetical protein